MNLYKLSQSINDDYDTYDSVIVAAESDEAARLMHPSGFVTHHHDGKWYGTHSFDNSEYETENKYSSWVKFEELDKVEVELIGKAKEGTKRGIILASFNAG